MSRADRPLSRYTRLPGPSAREAEEQIAETVENASRLYDSRDLGARTRQDSNRLGDLRVDLTYDKTHPPAALEVTTLTNSATRATGSELLKLESELRRVVIEESLGEWMVGVSADSDLTELKPRLIGLIRDAQARAGIKMFRPDEPAADVAATTLELLNNAFAAGLVTALHLPSKEHGIAIHPPITDDMTERGFTDLLDDAMTANAQKLTEARPRETHLAVYIGRSDLSSEPSLTPPPTLPDAIDVLWVLLGYYNARYTYRLWRATSDKAPWSLLNHPLGRPPATST